VNLMRNGGFLGCCARLRDLLTERHAVQRAGRYDATRDADEVVIDIVAVGEVEDTEMRKPGAYFKIYHCKICKTMTDCKAEGSRKAPKTLCDACAAKVKAGKYDSND
jgi:hypothetical protein